MKLPAAPLLLLAALALRIPYQAAAQDNTRNGNLIVPASVTSGFSLSISISGSGQGQLYIVGPGQVLRQKVELGETVSLPEGALRNAGHYLVIVTGGTATETGQINVLPAAQPHTLSFLAEPSRVPVSLHDGINGTAYIFDASRNLITTPVTVSFQLSAPSGGTQQQNAISQNGVAWTRMNSAAKEGNAKFIARAGEISSTRVIDEVPGDPCELSVSAQPVAGKTEGKLELQTAPVRDCSGNPIPDGTVVTFTEALNGAQSTADVPIKHGIARVEMPAWNGATITVASGDVAGTQIQWRGKL